MVVSQFVFKEEFDFLGNVLIRALTGLDERLDGARARG